MKDDILEEPIEDEGQFPEIDLETGRYVKPANWSEEQYQEYLRKEEEWEEFAKHHVFAEPDEADYTLKYSAEDIRKRIRGGLKTLWASFGGTDEYAPPGWDTENPLPKHKDLAYIFNTLQSADQWKDLSREQRERILNIIDNVEEEEYPKARRCEEFDFSINKEKGRNHKNRKRARFIVTGKEEFRGKSEGNYKHYEQKMMEELNICSFDEFYDAIEECFGSEWKDDVLPVYGMDYLFRDEHEEAYRILKINIEEGRCPTRPENKDKPPILKPVGPRTAAIGLPGAGPVGAPPSEDDEAIEVIVSGVPGREDLDVRQDAMTPGLQINWSRKILSYGIKDPLKKYPSGGIKFPLDEAFQELFGYEDWKDYKRENIEDLKKDVIVVKSDGRRVGRQESLDSGDRVVSAPTFWPIHVAMAIKEFSDSRTPGQYLPTLLLASSEEINNAQQTIEKYNIGVDSDIGALSEESRDFLERRLGLTGIGKEYDPSGIGLGALEVGVRNPYEGLLSGGQEALNKAFASNVNKNQGEIGNQVVDLEGKPIYWVEKDPERPDKSFIITSDIRIVDRAKENKSKFGQVLVDQGSVVKILGTVPVKAMASVRRPGSGDEPDVEIDIGAVYFLPKDWGSGDRLGLELTEAEDILFKRLGVKDSSVAGMGGSVYKMDLDTGKTGVLGIADYEVEAEEDPLRIRALEISSERDRAAMNARAAAKAALRKQRDVVEPEKPLKKQIEAAVNDLIIRSGGKWGEDPEVPGRKVPEAPAGFNLSDPLPEHKDLAYYFNTMMGRPWEELELEEKQRILNILNIDTAQPIEQPEEEEEVLEPGTDEVEYPGYSKKSGEPKYSFIVGDLDSNGKIYRKLNENDDLGHGASMPKPILALVQLLKYRNEPEKQLSAEELKNMLSYYNSKGGSNYMSKVVTGRVPDHAKRLGRKIGTISEKDAKEALKNLGLDPNMGITFDHNNEQTPKQYFDFMRLIHDHDRLSELGIEKEAQEILGYMTRTKKGLEIGDDRESKRWSGFIKALREAGFKINSLYGKGGLIKRGWHYALVINDKYLVTIYTNTLPGARLYAPRNEKERTGGRKHHQWFREKLVEILDGVVPRESEESPPQSLEENISLDMKTIFEYIDEVLRNK